MAPRILSIAAVVLAALAGGFAQASGAPPQAADALRTARVTSGAASEATGYDGVVQAVRQTVVAAQVSGAVVALDVKAGDTVKAGQVLLRLDARAAEQAAASSAAQVRAARATHDAAAKDFERQRQLFEKGYISQAALDRAEAQFKTAEAQTAAQLASASAARTESDFYIVRAPYGGVIADVTVVLGDMAMPGRPMLTMYDPAALRISVPVPQTVASRLRNGAPVQIELPDVVQGRIEATTTQLLPAVDAASHTQELRVDLTPAVAGARPGMFARAYLPTSGPSDTRLYVPSSAIVRRAELAAVYVVDSEGHALLRQVRLGRPSGDRIEVLSGLDVGERVALDPQAAARIRSLP
ncbi:MAG TPA: efflux RND transporter periplasmic adaptor subunit [Casimicrobiaceae bacterium]|nr:efflux RND transporter periplasmic adaptor subunit [Casimicrobiaceae bacterium]